MTVTGILKNVTEPTSGTSKAGKEWVKCFAIIETQETYPKTIAVCLMKNELILAVHKLQKGAVCSFDVNTESREFNGNWSTNITAWRVL